MDRRQLVALIELLEERIKRYGPERDGVDLHQLWEELRRTRHERWPY
jgi:hypothetical protein